MRRFLDVRDAVCRLVSLLGVVPAWQPLQGLGIDDGCLVANEGCFWESKERQEEDEPDDGCRNLINNTPVIVDGDETVGPLDDSYSNTSCIVYSPSNDHAKAHAHGQKRRVEGHDRATLVEEEQV